MKRKHIIILSVVAVIAITLVFAYFNHDLVIKALAPKYYWTKEVDRILLAIHFTELSIEFETLQSRIREEEFDDSKYKNHLEELRKELEQARKEKSKYE